jgi:diguanylate cyclase (GGDEF)-like protein
MKNAKILLVDDIEANLISLEYLLHDYFEDIDTLSVLSGEEALKVAFSDEIDLIILDIQMPGMDGFETAKYLKTNPKTKAIPIIFLTAAFKEEEFQKKGFEIGAVDYLTKPINNNLLLNKLKLYVEIFTKNNKLKELNNKLTQIIQHEKQLHRENKKQKNLLQTILDTEQNLVFITDFKEISFANHAFLEFFCVKNIEEFQNRNLCIFNLFLDEANALETKTVRDLPKEEQGEALMQIIQTHKDVNRVVYINDCNQKKKSFFINLSKSEEEKLYLLSLTNITKMQENYVNIAKQAFYDGLTGVYNRTKFNEFVLYEIERSTRVKHSFSCILLDIDHFKKVNDTYGHLVGDEILITLVKTMQKYIRTTDKFARWGGEEFVILLVDTSDKEALVIAQKLRKIVEKIQHPIAGNISASFGVTEYREGDGINSLFKRCDDALYRAKEGGRNRVEII